MLKNDAQKQVLFTKEDKGAKWFEAISTFVFTHPELGDQEFISSQYLAEEIAKAGFTVTKPYCDMETAFRAEFSNGDGPTVAFLAEYDALPGYGPNRDENGHACGHNWIAASTFAAAVSLKETMEELGIKGRVVYMGTPAEESTSRKMDLVAKGAFDDIDAVFQMHLGVTTNIYPVALANAGYIFEFFGRASHAAGSPELGINALDAVNLTFAGINCLRQHVTSDVRLHGYIMNGGRASNVVPEYASMEMYTRAGNKDYLEEVNEKVVNVAKGAALMTGTELKVTRENFTTYDIRNNTRLVEMMAHNLKEGFGLESTGNASIYHGAGSTDIGNVSYAVPTCYTYMGTSEVSPAHTHDAAFLEVADSEHAHKQLHIGAKCMGASALDLMIEPAIIKEL